MPTCSCIAKVRPLARQSIAALTRRSRSQSQSAAHQPRSHSQRAQSARAGREQRQEEEAGGQAAREADDRAQGALQGPGRDAAPAQGHHDRRRHGKCPHPHTLAPRSPPRSSKSWRCTSPSKRCRWTASACATTRSTTTRPAHPTRARRSAHWTSATCSAPSTSCWRCCPRARPSGPRTTRARWA